MANRPRSIVHPVHWTPHFSAWTLFGRMRRAPLFIFIRTLLFCEQVFHDVYILVDFMSRRSSARSRAVELTRPPPPLTLFAPSHSHSFHSLLICRSLFSFPLSTHTGRQGPSTTTLFVIQFCTAYLLEKVLDCNGIHCCRAKNSQMLGSPVEYQGLLTWRIRSDSHDRSSHWITPV